MLDDADVVAFLPTARPDDARAFYRDTLGLLFIKDDQNHIVFDSNGTVVRLQRVDKVTPTGITQLSWEVADIVNTIEQLKGRGVAFKRYPDLEQDANDIWTAYDGTMVAWFEDPDGNLLSLSEHAEMP